MIIKNRFVRDTLGDAKLFYAILVVLIGMAIAFKYTYTFAGIAVVIFLAHAKAKSDNYNIEKNIIDLGSMFNDLISSYEKDVNKEMDDELVDLYEANILSIGKRIKDLEIYNYYSPNYINLRTSFTITSSHILMNVNLYRLNKRINDKLREINNI